MNRISVMIKKLQLGKLLTACLISAFLVIGISFSSVGNAALANSLNPQAGQIEDGTPANPVPSDYETTDREPGMNNHRDIEVRRMNTKQIDAESKALIDKSARHLKDRTGNPAEAVSRVIDKAPEGIQTAGRNLKEGTADRLGNLKESTGNIGNKIQQAANGVGETLKSTIPNKD